jgi:hypothetical protein
MKPQTSIADVWKECKGRSATLNGVEHHLVLQVGSKDVLMLGAQTLIIGAVLLEGNLIGAPEESKLGLGQFLEDGKPEVGVLLNTETGAEEHRLLGGIVWSCVEYGH